MYMACSALEAQGLWALQNDRVRISRSDRVRISRSDRVRTSGKSDWDWSLGVLLVRYL
jgi:hypothetical protein